MKIQYNDFISAYERKSDIFSLAIFNAPTVSVFVAKSLRYKFYFRSSLSFYHDYLSPDL